MGESLDDLIALSKERKAQDQVERRERRTDAPVLLEREGINFTRHNHVVDGTSSHYVLTHHGLVADFWPGRGKWRVRSTGERGRGVVKLVARLRRAERGA